MLSSFIALAAGLIGGVDVSAASVTAAPAAIVETPAAAPAEPNLNAVVTAPSDTHAGADIVRTQATDLESETAEDDTPDGSEESLPTPVETMTLERPPTARDTVGQSSDAPDPSIVSPNQRRAILKEASNALARTRTAQGRFVQIDQSGMLSEGLFYLQRPGRMRFEYDDPVPILIASDGVTVAMQDRELDTVDRVPLASTPLGLLLSSDVDFETDAEVLRVQRANGLVAITVIDPTEESDGELTMIFNANTYDLLGWRVVDANNGLTNVQLDDVQTGISLNPRLFIIQDSEDEDEDDRR